MERETEAEEDANRSAHRRDGLGGAAGSSHCAKVGPKVCYGAKVWMRCRRQHVPMCCFLLQRMEINISMQPNSLVQTAASLGDL